MKKIIFFHPLTHNIVFVLAAALQAGYKILPALSMETLWDSDADEIILLDIHMDNNFHFPDLDIYLEFKNGTIKSTLYTEELYADFIQEKNLDKLKFWPPEQNHSGALEIIGHLLANNRQMIKDAIAMADENLWLENKTASRYGKALYAAGNKAKNMEDYHIYTEAIIAAAVEISTAPKRSLAVEEILNGFARGRDSLAAALEKLSAKAPFEIPGKKGKIGFAYIDTITPWLDIDRLRNEALNRFPYMAVIQYRQNNEDLTWIGSTEINISGIFSTPLGSGYNKNRITLIGPANEMIDIIRRVITNTIS
jgi:hypothetical protein